MEDEPISVAEVEEDKQIAQEDLEGKRQRFGHGVKVPPPLEQIDGALKRGVRDGHTPPIEDYGRTVGTLLGEGIGDLCFDHYFRIPIGEKSPVGLGDIGEKKRVAQNEGDGILSDLQFQGISQDEMYSLCRGNPFELLRKTTPPSRKIPQIMESLFNTALLFRTWCGNHS